VMLIAPTFGMAQESALGHVAISGAAGGGEQQCE
jgi:hypothetical protein